LTYWLHGKKGYDKPLPAFDKFVLFAFIFRFALLSTVIIGVIDLHIAVNLG